MNLADFAIDPQMLMRISLTIFVVVGVTVARRIAVHRLTPDESVLTPQKRRQIFYVRTAFNIVLAAGVLMIWLGLLQNLLLSLTAVTVALVVATKELLMCVSGFALRTGANSFSVGDWIRVDGIRGEVTDFNLLSTSMLELGVSNGGLNYTGHRIVLPNSIFLTRPVRNERVLRHFVLHSFDVVVDHLPEVGSMLDWLESYCHARFSTFEGDARRLSASIDRKLGVDLPGPEPVVSVHTTDNAKLAFRVTLFCPLTRAEDLQRDITCALLDRIKAQAEKEAGRTEQARQPA
ncbi:MAG: mechanosensitive ion channel family protein [Rhodocyclaceae bacterium]|nr:mechanosensitive ion channel family protein [Rhodocyclaceae bacterium]